MPPVVGVVRNRVDVVRDQFKCIRRRLALAFNPCCQPFYTIGNCTTFYYVLIPPLLYGLLILFWWTLSGCCCRLICVVLICSRSVFYWSSMAIESRKAFRPISRHQFTTTLPDLTFKRSQNRHVSPWSLVLELWQHLDEKRLPKGIYESDKRSNPATPHIAILLLLLYV